MRTNEEYLQVMTQAKENLADLNERGADAVGGNVLEFMESILTPDEIAGSKDGSGTEIEEQEKTVEVVQALKSLVGAIPYTDMSLEELKEERLKKYENIE